MAFTGRRKFGKYNDGVESTNGTIFTALTITTPTDSGGSLTGYVVARDKTNNKVAKYKIDVFWRNVAGTAAGTNAGTSAGDSGLNGVALASWDVSGADMRLRLTGIAATNIDWQWQLEYIEV